MSSELYQQVDPEDVGMSSAYLGNVDALQERYLAENVAKPLKLSGSPRKCKDLPSGPESRWDISFRFHDSTPFAIGISSQLSTSSGPYSSALCQWRDRANRLSGQPPS